MIESEKSQASNDGDLGVRERAILAAVLGTIALLAGIDVAVDLRQGASAWHVLFEVGVVVVACVGATEMLRGLWRLRKRLDVQDLQFSDFRQQADIWRTESKKYLDGLSKAIAVQLDRWQLSAAEKEVAFLLLKGLSLKEIANARHTTEKTARVQSSAVYTKSGLAGRSALSAFFLEDLLPPGQAAGEPPSAKDSADDRVGDEVGDPE